VCVFACSRVRVHLVVCERGTVREGERERERELLVQMQTRANMHTNTNTRQHLSVLQGGATGAAVAAQTSPRRVAVDQGCPHHPHAGAVIGEEGRASRELSSGLGDSG
jgi:hypothetical protein